jgi:hypothetical protein
MPQPNFVPVSPKTSRSTHSKGISAGTSTFLDSPLICKFVMEIHLLPFPDTLLHRGQTTVVVPLPCLDSAQDLSIYPLVRSNGFCNSAVAIKGIGKRDHVGSATLLCPSVSCFLPSPAGVTNLNPRHMDPSITAHSR